jgi:hypothetical protein
MNTPDLTDPRPGADTASDDINADAAAAFDDEEDYSFGDAPPPPPADLAQVEDGSAPRILWHGLWGSLLGFVTVPAVCKLFEWILLRFTHGQPPPTAWWASAFALMMLTQVGFFLLMRRCFSTAFAASFAVCAFFMLIPAVGMLSDVTSLNTP